MTATRILQKTDSENFTVFGEITLRSGVIIRRKASDYCEAMKPIEEAQ